MGWGSSTTSGRDGYYDAFISYSHAADGRLAPALQLALHRFAKPWYRMRAVRVFRDDASLSANAALWSSIVDALDRSRSFILLASPESASSSWVAGELRYWCDHKPADRVLLALTAGDLHWDDHSGDFDWSRTTALSSNFSGVFAGEPRWIDLRWARDSPDVSLSHPRFQECVADIAAPLHGRDKDELIGEDVRQHRRTRRLARAVTTVLAALVVVAALATVVAVDQRNAARRERDVAHSQFLAAQALAEKDVRLDRSLLLGVEAIEERATPEARAALLGALESTPELVRLLHGVHASSAAVATTPSGRVAAADGNDIALWDLSSDGERVDLSGHEHPVIAVAYVDEGRSIVSVDEGGVLATWTADGSSMTATEAVGVSPVDHVALSADGSLASVVSDGDLLVWDIEHRRRVAVIPAPEFHEIRSSAFSPTADMLAYGTDGGLIRLWDVDARTSAPGSDLALPVGDYSQTISQLQFNHDGTKIASAGGGGGGVDVWDVSTRAQLSLGLTAGERKPVTALAFNDADSMLVVGHVDGQIVRWGLHGGSEIGSPLPGHGTVTGLSFVGDTRMVSSSADGPIAVWDLESDLRLGRSLHTGASDAVDDVAFSPDGDRLAAVSLDGLRLFRTTDGVEEHFIAGGTFDAPVFYNAVAFSPTGDHLAVGTSDGEVLVWRTDDLQAPPARLAHGDRVSAVVFDPLGRHIVSTSEAGTVVFWDVDRRTRLGMVEAGGEPVHAVAFSPDGAVLVTGGFDGSVILWDAESRTPLGSGPPAMDGPVRAVAFSSDGGTLAIAGADGTVLWDVDDDRTLRRVDPGAETETWDVALTPDGSTLVTAGDALRLWDVGSGLLLGEAMVGEPDLVLAVEAAPDGTTVAWGALTIAPKPIVGLWDADESSWVRNACALAGRSFDEVERVQFLGDRTADPACR